MVTRVAIGVGCRKNASGEAIAALVREALSLLPRAPEAAQIFTLARKADEPGLCEAAAALGFELVFLSEQALSAVETRLTTRSARVRALVGVDSVAEAAALVGGGDDCALVVPRIVGAGVACAVAADARRIGETT